ncbi:MAG TPA: hypothetical protein VFU21_27855 [Kofleriaceae bacterium]|nr:hypothetical protein [Kofleriaceae bacterium]
MTGEQYGAGTASDGSNHLVAWVDRRARYGSSIRVARVADDGSVLDPGGVSIHDDGETLFAPSQVAVGFDGESYLVAWSNYGIHAKRVSTDGVAIDATPIALASTTRPAGPLAIAFDGTRYLVSWSASTPASTQTDVYASRVSPAGEDLDPEDLRIARTTSYETLQGLATSGGDFLAIWYESGNQRIRGAFVTGLDGAVGASFSASAAAANPAAVTFDGTNYLVSWRRTSYILGNPNLFARRVSPGGGPIDPIVPVGIGDSIALAFDGSNTVALSSRRVDDRVTHMEAVRISPEAAVLDDPPIAASSTRAIYGRPEMAAGGAAALAVWHDRRFGQITEPDVFGARVTPDGSAPDPAGIAIVTGGNVQRAPTVTWDGARFAVAWEDHRDPTTDLYMVDVDPVSGPVSTATQLVAGERWHSRVAAAGSPAGRLLVWRDQPDSSPSRDDIHAARVEPDGDLVDDPALVVGAAAVSKDDPSVAAGAAGYLVAWSEWRGDRQVYAARVGLDGARPDGDGFLLDADGETPSVASNGDGYLVAAVGNDPFGPRDIRIHIGSREGAFEGPPIIYPAAVNQSSRPTAAWNGQHYLVLWNGLDVATSSILVARFAPDGTPLDAAPVRVVPGIGGAPRVASGSRTSLVTWYDGDAVRGAWFTSGGVVVPPGGFAIAAVDPTSEWSPAPAAACDAEARCLVSFERASPEEPRTPRVHLVRVTLVDVDGDEIDDEFDPEVSPPEPDAGSPAGGPDAAATGSPDSGANAADAGGGAPREGGGCAGCRLAGQGSSAALLLLVAVVVLRLRLGVRRPGVRCPRTPEGGRARA